MALGKVTILSPQFALPPIHSALCNKHTFNYINFSELQLLQHVPIVKTRLVDKNIVLVSGYVGHCGSYIYIKHSKAFNAVVNRFHFFSIQVCLIV